MRSHAELSNKLRTYIDGYKVDTFAQVTNVAIHSNWKLQLNYTILKVSISTAYGKHVGTYDLYMSECNNAN